MKKSKVTDYAALRGILSETSHQQNGISTKSFATKYHAVTASSYMYKCTTIQPVFPLGCFFFIRAT